MPIILGRLFLAIRRVLVDIQRNELKFRLNDEEVNFDICKLMKQPKEINMVLVIDVMKESNIVVILIWLEVVIPKQLCYLR